MLDEDTTKAAEEAFQKRVKREAADTSENKLEEGEEESPSPKQPWQQLRGRAKEYRETLGERVAHLDQADADVEKLGNHETLKFPATFETNSATNGWQVIENVSRFTPPEMEVALHEIKKDIRANEQLVAYFTSVKKAQMIIAEQSYGFRASSISESSSTDRNQCEAVLSFTEIPDAKAFVTELGWKQWQGRLFLKTAGRHFFGLKDRESPRPDWRDMDAGALDVMFLVAAPKTWVETESSCKTFHGFSRYEKSWNRHNGVFTDPVEPLLLFKNNDSFYASKRRIRKIYIMKPGVEPEEEKETTAEKKRRLDQVVKEAKDRFQDDEDLRARMARDNE